MRLIIVFLMFFSCTENKRQPKDETITENVIKREDIIQKNNVIEEVNSIFKDCNIRDTIIDNVIQKSDGNITVVRFNFVDFPLYLISFTESERKFLYKKDIFSFELYTNLYNDEQSYFIDIGDVQIIKGDKQYFFMCPTYSEEFPSFKIIGFSKNNPFEYYGMYTYSYSDYDKLDGVSFEEVKYELFEENNIPKIHALSGERKIILSHIEEKGENDSILEEEKIKVNFFLECW